SRQRIVLNYNYEPFLGNLRPRDIADRLQRTLDYVVPYDKRILTSLNTGSPQILRARSWHRFKRTVQQIVDDLDGVAMTTPPQAADADGRGSAGRRLRLERQPADRQVTL